MNNPYIEQQISEVVLFSRYLRKDDDWQLVVWYELVRKLLENDHLPASTLHTLCKLVLSQSSHERLAGRCALHFYAPYVLRCAFIAGDFSRQTLSKMTSLYPLINNMDTLEVLDVHFFYQQLFGYPKKLTAILNEVRETSSCSSDETKPFVDAFNNANLSSLSSLTFLPRSGVKSAWKQLPWIKWQLKTMQSIL